MNKIISSALILLLNISLLSAQRIYFCDDYTSSGDPVGVHTKMTLPAAGGFVYVLYQNGPGNLDNGDYYLYIDKLSGNNYTPFDVKTITTDPSKKWFVYDCQFLTAGDYRLTVKNPNQVEMTKDFLSLILDKVTDKTTNVTSTFYYTNSRLEATTEVNPVTGVIPAAYTSFTISPTQGGRIYFKINNNGTALNTNKLIVFIDKKNNLGEFKPFDNQYFDLASKSTHWAYFYSDFFETGEYTLTVYNSAMVFINSVAFTISF
jgi:hypothetical protein